MNWQDDKETATAVIWVGDTQVTYVVAREEHGPGHFVAQRLVNGAAAKDFVTLGHDAKFDVAKQIAELDAEDVQAKGF